MSESDAIEWDCSFTWRIENFSSRSYKLDDQIVSPAFTVKSLSGRKWCLWLRPAGDKNSTEHVLCFLAQVLEDNSDKECIIDYEVIFINANREKLRTKTDKNRLFGREFDAWGWSTFIRIDRMKAEMKKCAEDTLIVRCCIKNKEEKKLVEKEARSCMAAENHFLKWIVRVLPNGTFSSGRHFFCLEDNLYRINLSADEDDLEINISKITKSISKSHPISGKITLSDAKGNEAASKSETFNFENEDNTWKFPSLITNKQLQDNSVEYVIDEEIIFLCEFSVCKGIETATIPKINNENISNIEGLVNLSNDFRSLLSIKSNTDVKLRACDAVELQAHKSILAARSPVFSSMFDLEMIENQTGIVHIEDVDSETLGFFLEFLYTGVVPNIECNLAIKLIVVAEKYQVAILKEVCASILNSSLTVDNVCGILVLADMVHHEVLKAASLELAAQHSRKIFSSPECSDWIRENPQLSAEILAYLGKKI